MDFWYYWKLASLGDLLATSHGIGIGYQYRLISIRNVCIFVVLGADILAR